MQLITELGSQEGIPCEHYRLRKTVQTVLYDHEGRVALINTGLGHHILPGMEVSQSGTDVLSSVLHQVRQDTGLEAEVTGEVGAVIRYCNPNGYLEVSYCYDAKVINHLFPALMVSKDRENGTTIEWYLVDDAISLMDKQTPTDGEAASIHRRDIEFLKQSADFPF